MAYTLVQPAANIFEFLPWAAALIGIVGPAEKIVAVHHRAPVAMPARPALRAVAVGNRVCGAHAANVSAHEPALHDVEIDGAGVVVQSVLEWRCPAGPGTFRAPFKFGNRHKLKHCMFVLDFLLDRFGEKIF